MINEVIIKLVLKKGFKNEADWILKEGLCRCQKVIAVSSTPEVLQPQYLLILKAYKLLISTRFCILVDQGWTGFEKKSRVEF